MKIFLSLLGFAVGVAHAGVLWDSSFEECMKNVKSWEDKYGAQYSYCKKKFPDPSAKSEPNRPEWEDAKFTFDESLYPPKVLKFKYYIWTYTRPAWGAEKLLPAKLNDGQQFRIFINCQNFSFHFVGLPNMNPKQYFDLSPDDQIFWVCHNK